MDVEDSEGVEMDYINARWIIKFLLFNSFINNLYLYFNYLCVISASSLALWPPSLGQLKTSICKARTPSVI